MKWQSQVIKSMHTPHLLLVDMSRNKKRCTPSFPVYRAYLNFFVFSNLQGSSPSHFQFPRRIKSLHVRIKKEHTNACNVSTQGISNGFKIVVGRLCHIGFLMMCHTINEGREEGCMYMNQHPLHKLQCRMREHLIYYLTSYWVNQIQSIGVVVY